MTQTNQAQIVASMLRSIDAGGLVNTQLDKAATLMESQHARILELEAELLTEKRHQRTRDVAAVRTLGALGFNWNGGDVWQAAPKAVCETEKEQIQALMDKHQIWIQQTRYEELDKPPYDLYAVQAEKHQFEAFVQDLIALYTIQPAAQPLITALENIAYTYAMNLRDAACATYGENTERMARNAKSALTTALQGLLCKQPATQALVSRDAFESAYAEHAIAYAGLDSTHDEVVQTLKEMRDGDKYSHLHDSGAWIGWQLAIAAQVKQGEV